jgi:drug/metabolite transporter (DMT)-like permease
MSGYEEPPRESGAWAAIASVFAVPLRPVPRYLQSLRGFAGTNPLKWMLVALALVGYALAILLYFVFALFPAISYVLLLLLTLPLLVAVYAWKGAVRAFGRERRSAGPAATPAAIAGRPVVGRRKPA